MRSSLSVCCLAIVLGTGCFEESVQGDRSPEDSDESDGPEYDQADEAVYDESDGPVSWHDASIPVARDASPKPPPSWPVDAGCDDGLVRECLAPVLVPLSCVTREQAPVLLDKYCGVTPGSTGDWRPTAECKGVAGELWVSCCLSSKPEVPVPEDAGAPNVPGPSNCSLLRLGDDRTCVDSELLEKEARVACASEKGELKSLTLLGAKCAGGASAAEATCCFPNFL